LDKDKNNNHCNMNFDLNNRKFRAYSNSRNGEVSPETIFHYHQEKDLIWADYSGGDILKGFLVGTTCSDISFNLNFQHVNISMEIMTGRCESTPYLDVSGRIMLSEKWEWTCKDFSKGKSKLIEI